MCASAPLATHMHVRATQMRMRSIHTIQTMRSGVEGVKLGGCGSGLAARGDMVTEYTETVVAESGIEASGSTGGGVGGVPEKVPEGTARKHALTCGSGEAACKLAVLDCMCHCVHCC